MTLHRFGERGSATVEASILVPFIMLCITAMVYVGLVLYQRAQIQSAADMSAEAGAAVWRYAHADAGTGRVEQSVMDDTGLYWRLIDAGKEGKLQTITDFTEKALKKGRLLIPEKSEVTVDIKDMVIYKRLEVSVENVYELPFGRLLRVFGESGNFSIKVKSGSVIDDPAEFRRNLDFAVDVEKELEDTFPGLKDLREKAGEVLSGLKGKIDDFLK